ncbi:hypothetical protein FLM9_745 [Candidatus Synechococcus spongiarum]|uniref:Uncharacterized protein n=1 Tax=Candidatus Synechococcus spongiarum TaxID=431041 RepID=A0A164Z744_9SYNE|nr:hypothetical protein FLM9_745 [Candidatus Synechococcus spongiarum]
MLAKAASPQDAHHHHQDSSPDAQSNENPFPGLKIATTAHGRLPPPRPKVPTQLPLSVCNHNRIA